MVTCALEGDLAQANELNDALFDLTHACFIEVNPIPAKAGMAMLGFDAGIPRLPLTPLEEQHADIMRAALAPFAEVKA